VTAIDSSGLVWSRRWLFAAVVGIPDLSHADEGGTSFWQPGTYDSLAAVPNQPGWSFAATYYHASANAGSAVAAAQEIRIGRLDPNLKATLSANSNYVEDSISVSPSYVFATPVLGHGRKRACRLCSAARAPFWRGR
jgi:hypothetical protein